MEHHRETFETWNNIAQLYEEKFMDLPLYNHTYDLFCDLLPPHQAKVLEVGCGPGNITRYLLLKKPGLNILGTDIAPNMLAIARKHNPTADFVELDCRNITTLQAGYDGIVSGFCLPYLSPEEALSFIGNSAALLNEGGVLYVSFVEGTPEMSGFKTGSGGNRTYFYYHEKKALYDAMESNRLQLIQAFEVPYPGKDGNTDTHTVMVVKKVK